MVENANLLVGKTIASVDESDLRDEEGELENKRRYEEEYGKPYRGLNWRLIITCTDGTVVSLQSDCDYDRSWIEIKEDSTSSPR